jgi:hypothetical protein
MTRYIILVILIILLFISLFNLNLRENLMTDEEIEKLDKQIRFNEKVRLLREESIRKTVDAESKISHLYINDDTVMPYLSEYQCLDYEDIRI